MSNLKRIFLIIPIIFLALVFFSSAKPLQAKDICCEIRYSISDSRPTRYEFVKTEAECPKTPGNPNYFIMTGDYERLCDKPAKEAVKLNPIVPPVLSVSIPGFGKFSTINCSTPGENCKIPWIAEYIKALYKYSTSIIGILAAIVIMIGGVIWLTASGNKERIGAAMNFIKGGIMGLAITLCSYLLLVILSPNLIILNPLNISYIKKGDLPDMDLSKSAAELGMTEGELSNLQGENPYRAGCGDIEKCKKFGDKRPDGLVPVESQYAYKSGLLVNPKAYEAFKKAVACVNPKKIMFKIKGGQRTANGQIEMRRLYGNYAASPCCSNHGSGMGMDIIRADGTSMDWDYNESSGFKKCMADNGLFAKLNGSINEPWHFSPSGR